MLNHNHSTNIPCFATLERLLLDEKTRFSLLKESMGNMIPDLMNDYDNSIETFSDIKTRYSNVIADLLSNNLKYISEVALFYNWLNMSNDWIWRAPYCYTHTMSTFIHHYRINEEGFGIVSKLLRELKSIAHNNNI